MTGPLEYIVQFLTILDDYSFLLPLKPYSYMKCPFNKTQSRIAIQQYIAIHSNTIHNTALTHIVSPLMEAICFSDKRSSVCEELNSGSTCLLGIIKKLHTVLYIVHVHCLIMS